MSDGREAEGLLAGVESESDTSVVSRTSDIENTKAGSCTLLSGRSWELFCRRKDFGVRCYGQHFQDLDEGARSSIRETIHQYESCQLRLLKSLELPASVSEGRESRLTPEAALRPYVARSLSVFSSQLTSW